MSPQARTVTDGGDRYALVRDEALLSVVLTSGLSDLTAYGHLNAACTTLSPLLDNELPRLPPCPPAADVPAALDGVRDRLVALRRRSPRAQVLPLAYAARWVGFASASLRSGEVPLP